MYQTAPEHVTFFTVFLYIVTTKIKIISHQLKLNHVTRRSKTEYDTTKTVCLPWLGLVCTHWSLLPHQISLFPSLYRPTGQRIRWSCPYHTEQSSPTVWFGLTSPNTSFLDEERLCRVLVASTEQLSRCLACHHLPEQEFSSVLVLCLGMKSWNIVRPRGPKKSWLLWANTIPKVNPQASVLCHATSCA